MTSPKLIPPHNAARFKAGELIYREGAKTAEELFAAINFGNRYSSAKENMQRSIESGWLVSAGGVISCGAAATAYYEARANEVEKLPEPEPEPVGQMAEPRIINLMPVKAYVPPPKPIRRADAFDNSLAAIPSFYGKARP